MRKLLSLLMLTSLLLIHVGTRADEGMWLVSLIGKNMHEMQRLGLKLTANDIYSINQSCIKDAIVKLSDAGCSASLISGNGLTITNYHCAIGNIQSHSTVAKNYLRDGFWAQDYKEELPIPNKTATILHWGEEVTPDLVRLIEEQPHEHFYEKEEGAIEQFLANNKPKSKDIEYRVVPMFEGNQYMLFAYTVYEDVRLVGSPPSSIGEFGGDVDNWTWPRHTGDFALFRIYTAPNGKPAKFHKRNKPLQPKHFLSISLQGVQEGDFTMVLGYPGTTHRFATSYEAYYEQNMVAPWVDAVWGAFILALKGDMEKDEQVKIDYTDTYSTLVNFWQKDTYQAESMRKDSVFSQLIKRDAKLIKWARDDLDQRAQFIDAYKYMEDFYIYLSDNQEEEQMRSIVAILMNPVEVGNQIIETYNLINELFNPNSSARKVKKEAKKVREKLPQLFENYHAQTDALLFGIAFQYAAQYVSQTDSLPLLDGLKQHYDIPTLGLLLGMMLHSNSIFTDYERMDEFLLKPTTDSLLNDGLLALYIEFSTAYEKEMNSYLEKRTSYDEMSRIIVQGQLSMDTTKLWYPDANTTMRLTYGKVLGYKPADGRIKHPNTYLDGVMQKNAVKEEDQFVISPKLKELFDAKDYGAYADSVGLPVCFITDNDITNGNSGSPVLNAHGQLVGLAFDGNREAMACDFMYNPQLQRTICVDIRYVLFVIDKFAGAQHILDELSIAN